MPKFVYKRGDIKTIINLAKNGDIKALEELIRRVQKHVYAMFSYLTNKNDDVADLTQIALLKMARSLPQLSSTNRFKPWLNQIITNVFYDYARRNKKNIIEYDETKIKEIKDKIGCEPGEKCLFNEVEKLVRLALMTLPKDLRISLVLREYEGLSYNDIAQITNSAIGTVKSRISRARLKLQQQLKDFI